MCKPGCGRQDLVARCGSQDAVARIWKPISSIANDGATHENIQEAAGEQGCPLMPALCALAQHDALVSTAGKPRPNERLFAFLGDLYVLSSPTRAATASQTVAQKVETHAGAKSQPKAVASLVP